MAKIPKDFFFANVKRKQVAYLEIQQKNKKDIGPSLMELSKALDEYYVFHKLRIYCEMLSYADSFKTGYEMPTSDLDFLNNWIVRSVNLSPKMLVYVYIKDLLERELTFSKCTEIIRKIEKTVKEEETLIDRKDQINIFSLITTFCVKQYNLGKEFYLPTTFRFYIHIINIKHESKKASIYPSIFANLVAAAIKLKTDKLFHTISTINIRSEKRESGFVDGIDWAYNFIEFYHSRISNSSIRKAYHNYCLALIEFEKKEYITANNLLKKISNVHGRFISLKSKTLRLQILFEIHCCGKNMITPWSPELEQVLDAYRKQINYELQIKKDLGYTLQIFKEFEHLFRRLYNLYKNYLGLYLYKNPNFITKKQSLYTEVQDISHGFKDWFLDKLDNVK